MGGDAGMKKVQLIKRLTNSAFNLEVQAVNALLDFLKSERNQDELNRIEFERQQKEKDRLLRRMMDGNLRVMGQALRQFQLHAEAAAEAERVRMARQRGIMRRIVDSNVRIMGMGYNKLIESWKERTKMLKDKLKFIIKSLTDKDAAYTLAAFNGMRERKLLLDCVGFDNAAAQKLKVRLIRKITDSAFNLQTL